MARKLRLCLSGTDTSDLPVPETSQTGSLKVTTSNPTKVDLPGLRISTSLGQAAATTTSTTDLQPAASSGTASACQDSTPDQDLPDVESLPSGGDSGYGEISDTETQEQNEEMNYQETVRQSVSS